MPATIEEVRREQRGKGEGVSQPDAYYHFVANNARSKLALIRLKQGRLTDAEVFAREALLDSLKDSGHYSFYTAALVSPLVQVLMHQGRFSEAERLSNAGTQIYVAIGTPQDSVWVRNLRLQIAGIRIAQERYAEALAEYDSIYQSFSNSSKAQALIAQGSLGWALALVKTGRPADALSVLNRLIPLTKQFLGDRHIDYAELMGVRAMALQLLDRNLEALDAFRFVSPLLLYEDAAGGSDTSVIRATYRTLILESYLKLLGDLHSVGTIVSSGLNAPKESFKLADALRSLRTQRALSASAVRTAAQDEKMGIDIRRQQDLEQEEIGLYQLLGEMINLAPDQQASDAIADLRKRIVAVGQARKQLESEIRKRFPAYDNLLHPASPDVVDVQTAMHADEAVVNIFTTDSGTYVWAFRKDGETAFVRSALSKRDLRTLVRSIRKSLDPGAVDISKNLPDFDVNAGYRIFSELLVPVAAGWRGAAQMIVSSNDALSQLPLAVLPTTMAAVGTRTRLTYENHRALPWLIQQLAISQVPSVNSLLSLRNMQSGKLDRQSFIGFGDPQFALDAAPVQPNNGLRNLDIPRPSASELSTRKALKWLDYSVLPALPDTRDEVLSIARSLKADTDKDVYLGKQASRANVMSLDLSKRRVVAFATHGLLPGDFPGVMVPSLALANPGGGQYGLLTLEDILTLKLDADWVVLSACNTGSGEGQGSEALSGLARGFFYAGSRTLLVTMWPVESGSARLLVTGLFERLVKGQASVSRAEALRQSILALMQQSDAEQHVSYAHPLFWAPYVVVGEGGP
jgi:CHAT domain-containing protein